MSPSRWTRKLFKRFHKPSPATFDQGPASSQFLATDDFFDQSHPSLNTDEGFEQEPQSDNVQIEPLSQAADAGANYQQSSSDNYQAPLWQINPDDLKMLFCRTCFRTLPESEFPEGPILESCQHEPVICLDCLEGSIVEGLDVNLPQVIGCPQCGVTMSANDVWRFSRARTFERSELMQRLTTVKECVICVETLPILRFPQARVTNACSHESNTCLKCLSRYIQTQLEFRMWNQLNCPECSALLRYDDVRKYAREASFQTYDSLTMKHPLSSDPNFRWCTAAGCSSGQIHSDSSSLMVCNSCQGRSCFTHQSPWHGGMTCQEESDRRAREQQPAIDQARQEEERQAQEAQQIRARQRNEELATTSLRIRKTKKCPGGCGSRIEKIHGCDQMTCFRCHYEFCWQCLEPWTRIRLYGNDYHLRICEYHTKNMAEY